MATHRRTWQKAEQRGAAMWGTTRKAGSGSMGQVDATHSDSEHPGLYLEGKLRPTHAVRTLHDDARMKAAREGKRAVIQLFSKGRPGWMVCVHSDDLPAVMAEYLAALDDAGRERMDGLIEAARIRREGATDGRQDDRNG